MKDSITYDDLNLACDACDKVYNETCEIARAALREGLSQARRAYNASGSREAYNQAIDIARAAYSEAVAPAYEAYDRAIAKLADFASAGGAR